MQLSSSIFAKNFAVIVGILLCAIAVLAYWFGSYTFTPLEYHMLTLPILASGLILILFGSQTLKQLAFPIVFLFFLTPPPTEILYSVGSTSLGSERSCIKCFSERVWNDVNDFRSIWQSNNNTYKTRSNNNEFQRRRRVFRSLQFNRICNFRGLHRVHH